MKPVKNLVFALILVSSLTFTAFAGEIDVPGAPAPPPARLESTEAPATTDSNQGVALSDTSDDLFYEALRALLSVY
jgi:hypothetical protein